MNSVLTLETIRKLGFGALLGAGIGGLLFGLWPRVFPGATLQGAIFVGTAIGSGASQMLESWVNALLKPVSRRAKHYSKLVELAIARSNGTITEDQAAAILQQLQADYFLGDTRIPVRRGLPDDD